MRQKQLSQALILNFELWGGPAVGFALRREVLRAQCRWAMASPRGFRKQLDVQRLLDAATRWCGASSATARGQGADGVTSGLGAADMRQVTLAHADATRRR